MINRRTYYSDNLFCELSSTPAELASAHPALQQTRVVLPVAPMLFLLVVSACVGATITAVGDNVTFNAIDRFRNAPMDRAMNVAQGFSKRRFANHSLLWREKESRRHEPQNGGQSEFAYHGAVAVPAYSFVAGTRAAHLITNYTSSWLM